MSLNIKDYLSQSSLEFCYSGELTEHDIKVSSVVLLAALARADGELEEQELSAMMGIAAREFEIKESEAGEILQVALLLSEDPLNVQKFAERINTCFNPLQKQLLMCLIWRVIISDQVMEKSEATLAVKVRDLLGLTMEESVRARKLAEIDRINIQYITAKLEE